MKAYYTCMHCGQAYSGNFCPRCGSVNPNLTVDTEKLSEPLSKKIMKIFDKNKKNSSADGNLVQSVWLDITAEYQKVIEPNMQPLSKN